MTTAQHLSLSNEHYTPKEIVEKARATFVLEQIDTDPATCEEINSLRVKANTIYTIETDGLDFNNKWNGSVFLNPPGGKTNNKSTQALWFSNALTRYNNNEISELIFIVFNIEMLRISQEELGGQLICIPKSRIAYDKYDTDTQQFVKQKSPPHSSMIVYLGKYEDRFKDNFNDLGSIFSLEYARQY